MESSAFHSEYLINEEQDEEDASDQRLLHFLGIGKFLRIKHLKVI